MTTTQTAIDHTDREIVRYTIASCTIAYLGATLGLGLSDPLHGFTGIALMGACAVVIYGDWRRDK